MGNGQKPRNPGSPIKQGSIYWLDNCPPLDGRDVKRRPVVVITPPAHLKGARDVDVVGCSASVTESDPSRIPLPNQRDEPQTKSGLPGPCWAIPRWLVVTTVDRLRSAEYCGHLTGAKLREVIEAALLAAKSMPPGKSGASR